MDLFFFLRTHIAAATQYIREKKLLTNQRGLLHEVCLRDPKNTIFVLLNLSPSTAVCCNWKEQKLFKLKWKGHIGHTAITTETILKLFQALIMMSRGGENTEQVPKVESNLTPKSPLTNIRLKFEDETCDIMVLEGRRNILITSNWNIFKWLFGVRIPNRKIRMHCHWPIDFTKISPGF